MAYSGGGWVAYSGGGWARLVVMDSTIPGPGGTARVRGQQGGANRVWPLGSMTPEGHCSCGCPGQYELTSRPRGLGPGHGRRAWLIYQQHTHTVLGSSDPGRDTLGGGGVVVMPFI